MSNIATCEFSHPRTNLGAPWTTNNHECSFAKAFAAAYDKRFECVHSGSSKVNRWMAHEVPVNGFGIADLVAVSCSAGSSLLTEFETVVTSNLTVRAFETKLSDWKKGIMQAHRYTYFSDVSILVMPFVKSELLMPRLGMFRSLGVGLWTFNSSTLTINAHFTPRPRKPASPVHRRKAVSAVYQAFMQGQPTL